MHIFASGSEYGGLLQPWVRPPWLRQHLGALWRMQPMKMSLQKLPSRRAGTASSLERPKPDQVQKIPWFQRFDGTGTQRCLLYRGPSKPPNLGIAPSIYSETPVRELSPCLLNANCPRYTYLLNANNPRSTRLCQTHPEGNERCRWHALSKR